MIEVKNLTFKYPNSDRNAIENIDFNIAKGEIFGFLGPSGAGKSTTQKILVKLLKKFQGSVNINGKSLKEWGNDFYENIGVSFEIPNHYLKLSGLENLKYFASLYDKEVNDPQGLLEKVNLGNDGKLLVGQYSKGMRVRLGFVRAVQHDPEILFLDEPTTGLDPVNARVIKDLVLEEKKKGHTVFLTTHNMSVARELCDRVGFLVEGKLKLIDSPKNLEVQHSKQEVVVEFQENGGTKTETYSLGDLQNDQGLISILKNKKIITIHSQEPTLEEIFIKITGERLS